MFMRGFGGNLSKAYLRANTFAVEAVSNIRTVAAFCSEDKVLSYYVQELEAPSRSSFRRGHIAGIFYGISQCLLFSSYGLALWYAILSACMSFSLTALLLCYFLSFGALLFDDLGEHKITSSF